jgi:uncharacterized protein (DUF1330 family)
VKEFAPLAQKALATGSGYKAIVRGDKAVSIEGAAPKITYRHKSFRQDEALKAYNSEAYKDARKIGDKYAMFRIYATEGAQ